MRKQESTNTKNKYQLEADCGMAYTISVLSGRWKMSILGFLQNNEKLRYSELKRKLTGISERMLISQLKELEADELVERIAYPEIPPRVEYQLSEKGRTLDKILAELSQWGEKNKLIEK
ncbi:MAG: winged helix-turn-helix transcriptional regulator [Lutibacter sp.]